MDYNEWLLDYYTINFAPVTASAGFSQVITIIAAGALISSFTSIIAGFYSDNVLSAIMPDVITAYTTQFSDPVDNYLEGTITPYLAGFGLSSVGNIIDQFWEGLNYVVVSVVFAYLSGDLTKDTNYA